MCKAKQKGGKRAQRTKDNNTPENNERSAARKTTNARTKFKATIQKRRPQGNGPALILAPLAPRPKKCSFTASSQRAPGKNGQHFVLLNGYQKRYNVSMCCGGFHSRSTLSGSRSPGRTPPSVGARTPCPKAKARTGSNTKHGLPHSTCTPLTSLLPDSRQGRQR